MYRSKAFREPPPVASKRLESSEKGHFAPSHGAVLLFARSLESHEIDGRQTLQYLLKEL